MTPSKHPEKSEKLTFVTTRDFPQDCAMDPSSEAETLFEPSEISPASSVTGTNFTRVVKTKTSYGTEVTLYQSSETGLKVFVADSQIPIVLPPMDDPPLNVGARLFYPCDRDFE
jgi:hypothetical protein